MLRRAKNGLVGDKRGGKMNINKGIAIFVVLLIATTVSMHVGTTQITSTNAVTPNQITYPVVDTGQNSCYDNYKEIPCPEPGEPFYGQDAQYKGNQPRYVDNADGTVTDLNTGLMWTKSPDLNGDGVIDANDKLTYEEALAMAENLTFAGYDDWRIPSIKELYSLIDFSGRDPSPNSTKLVPFIDTDYFDFAYGDISAGERIIDAQFVSSTKYVNM